MKAHNTTTKVLGSTQAPQRCPLSILKEIQQLKCLARALRVPSWAKGAGQHSHTLREAGGKEVTFHKVTRAGL